MSVTKRFNSLCAHQKHSGNHEWLLLFELMYQLGCLSSRKTWKSGALKARGLVWTHVGGTGTGSLLGSLPSSSSRIFWGYLPCARPCAKNTACLFSCWTWNGLGVLSLSSERKFESQSGVKTSVACPKSYSSKWYSLDSMGKTSLRPYSDDSEWLTNIQWSRQGEKHPRAVGKAWQLPSLPSCHSGPSNIEIWGRCCHDLLLVLECE